MSRSKYKVYNGKSLKKLFENSRIFCLTFMFVIGICVGSAMLESSDSVIEKISELFNTYSSVRSGQGILRNFLNSFAVNGIFMIINVFLGFSLIGYPFLTLLPLIKGLGLGAVCGYLYSAYKFTGLGYSLLMIIPGAIVSTFALLLACNNSCEYSKNACMKAIVGAGQFEKDETRLFLTRQLVFLIISAASSGIDAFLNIIFSSLFKI